MESNANINIVRLVAGAAVVVAFFLPFFDFGMFTVSGLEIGKSLVEMAGSKSGGNVFEFASSGFDNASGEQIAAAIALMIIAIGPIIFAIHGIVHVVKSFDPLNPKGRGGGFAILYVIVAIVFFAVLGKEAGVRVSFFDVAGPGFYITIPAILVAHGSARD